LARQGPELDERDRKILELLADGNGHCTQQVAEYLQISTRATRSRLRALIERGLVVEVGSSPQDPRRTCLLAARS
jgi:ATP-dependent DNA helicase RecG